MSGDLGVFGQGSTATFTTVTAATQVLTGATPTVAGGQVGLGVTTAATATAGAGGALPATVQAYLDVNIGGTMFKVPYFAV